MIAKQHLALWQATFENHTRQLQSCIVSAEPEFCQKRIASAAVVRAIQEYIALHFSFLKADAEKYGYHVRAVLDDTRTPDNCWYWMDNAGTTCFGYKTEAEAWEAAVADFVGQ